MNPDQLIARFHAMQTDLSTIVLSLVEQIKKQDQEILKLRANQKELPNPEKN
jgi:hypothetical protein